VGEIDLLRRVIRRQGANGCLILLYLDTLAR